MQINLNAKKEIKSNNKCMARLMIYFDRGQKSIENWIDNNDTRFQIPAVVEIIMQETKLKESQIFQAEKVLA